MPIVDYEHKAKVSYERFMNNNKISEKNKEDTKRYLNAIDVTPARIDIILTHLRLLFEKCEDLISKSDDRDYINGLFKSYKGKFSESYYQTLQNVGKAYVRWFNDNVTPKGWKDIKSKTAIKRDLRPKDMITWEDGLKISSQTPSTQFKAIIMTQLDGGFRPSEFIDLKYGDLTKEGKYYTARVDGKTGKRDVILFKCIPYLEAWLRIHPSKEPNSPLWIMEVPGFSHTLKESEDNKYNYFAILKRIKGFSKKAGIDKPIDFYNLRHSSAVIKKLDNIPADICALNMGHSVKHFTETYGRLSLKDLTNRYDKAYGLRKKDEEQNNPVVCQFCDTTNEPHTDYCAKCGNPLTLSVAVSERKKLAYISELINDSEKFEKITRAIEMINSKSV